jgi:hypothetical protein
MQRAERVRSGLLPSRNGVTRWGAVIPSRIATEVTAMRAAYDRASNPTRESTRASRLGHDGGTGLL